MYFFFFRTHVLNINCLLVKEKTFLEIIICTQQISEINLFVSISPNKLPFQIKVIRKLYHKEQPLKTH